jgi:hypothetical protein
MSQNPFTTSNDPLVEAAAAVLNQLTFIEIPEDKAVYGFFDSKGKPKSIWRGGPKQAIFKSFVTFEELATIRPQFKLTADETRALKKLEPGQTLKLFKYYSDISIKHYSKADAAKIVEWLENASAGSGPSSTKDSEQLFQYKVGSELLPKNSKQYKFNTDVVNLSKTND